MRFFRHLLLLVAAFCTTVVAQNPIPFVDQPLVPDSGKPGGKGFTLTVNGGGFISGSRVNWNGQALATTFVSGTQLRATVPASNIANPETASVSVANPGLGGGSSNVVFFPVRTPVKSFKLQENSLGYISQLAGDLAVADFNRDGILDFASYGLEQINVSLGNGDGTFQAPVTTYGNLGDGGGLVAADFNGDGIVDLAVANGGVYVFLGNGDGTFQNQIGTSTRTNNLALTAGDFNHDGKMDVALAGVDTSHVAMITILLGKGDGTFKAPRYIHLNHSDSFGAVFVTTADVNQDGILDLAVISDDLTAIRRRVSILLGKGDGSFKLLPHVSQALRWPSGTLALADFNGDGKLDLAMPDQNKVLILLGNGDGTFGPSVGYRAAGTGYGGIEVGDFNGDGIPDLAVAVDDYPGDPVISILRGVGDGTFRPDLKFNSSLYIGHYLAVGDFNNDGKLDLLLGASPDFGGVDVYLQELLH